MVCRYQCIDARLEEKNRRKEFSAEMDRLEAAFRDGEIEYDLVRQTKNAEGYRRIEVPSMRLCALRCWFKGRANYRID